MRTLVVLAWLATLTLAHGLLVGERAEVLYPDGKKALAEAVLPRAEAAIEVLDPWLGPVDDRLLYRLLPNGPFNGFASNYPLPGATLLLDFPYYDGLFLNDPDPLYTLVLHETVHLMHHRGPKLGLGLLLEGTTRPFPAWLTEGLAVYFESREGAGRLHHPETHGLLRALAGDPPPFWALGTAYTPRWPYGRARYLVGGAFVAYLVEQVGWDALKRAFAAYQRWPMPLALGDPRSFAAAWRRANPDAPELLELWKDFWQTIPPAKPAPGEHLAMGKKPALSPRGRLAYLSGSTLVAGERRFHHPLNATIRSLGWLGEGRLFFDRLTPRPTGALAWDLYLLDLESGRETRLARDVRYPAATPEGELCWARQRLEQDEVICAGRRRWVAPRGRHVVGLAPGKPFYLLLWNKGRVQIGRLRGQTFEPLPTPAPLTLGLKRWGDGLLVYAGGAKGYAAYRLEPRTGRLTRVAAADVGVFDPVAEGKILYYATPTPRGFELRKLYAPETVTAEPDHAPAPTSPTWPGVKARARPYDPLASFLPRGWWPLGLGVLLAGQDDANEHAWTLAVGWPFLALDYAYTPRFGLAPYRLAARLLATPELASLSLSAQQSVPLPKGSLGLGLAVGAAYAEQRAWPLALVRAEYAVGYAEGRDRVWKTASQGMRLFAEAGLLPAPVHRLGLVAWDDGLEAGLVVDGDATFTLGPRFQLPLDWAPPDGFSYLSHLRLTPRLLYSQKLGLGGELELGIYAASHYYLPAVLTLRTSYSPRGGWGVALGPRY